MSDDAGLVRDTGRFDLEADVVVVGGGGCGLTAAIADGTGAAGLSGHSPGAYFSGNSLLTALGYGMLTGQDAARAVHRPLP